MLSSVVQVFLSHSDHFSQVKHYQDFFILVEESNRRSIDRVFNLGYCTPTCRTYLDKAQRQYAHQHHDRLDWWGSGAQQPSVQRKVLGLEYDQVEDRVIGLV